MTRLQILAGILFFQLGLCRSASGEDNSYAASHIPAAMLKNANAVIRNSHCSVRIVSTHEIHITRSYAVTILNEKGAEQANVREWEDKMVSVTSIEGRLYDKDGTEIQKLKKKDIQTTSPYNYSLITDAGLKIFTFGYGVYPYTCEYEIETVQNSSFFIPSWDPQDDHDCAVESADLEVEYPDDLPLRYRTFHIDVQPTTSLDGHIRKLALHVKSIPTGSRPDGFSPLESYRGPTIIMAVDKFELLGQEGRMATWHDYGKFLFQLNANRDKLPDNIKTAVHQLTDTCKNPVQKINLLYDYLKKNTRYVSIQLGIGGWQTFDAKFVAEKGYGDCKALSNYMMALLKEAGIRSYTAEVYAGAEKDHPMLLDFPKNMFNHIILCVPLNADTVWLECTSKSLPAGYLSSFTDDRYVVLNTPEGGFPVRTPCNKAEQNLLSRTAEMDVDDNDEVHGTIGLKYYGSFWEHEQVLVVNEPRTKVDNYLNSKLKIGNYVVNNSRISNDVSGKVPVLLETLSIKGDGGVTHNPSHLFVSSEVFGFTMMAPASYEPRKGPFRINKSFEVSDTVIYKLPGKFKMEPYPGSEADLPFAGYHHKVVLEQGDRLCFITFYSQKEGVYPADSYADYISLYKRINADASNRLILTKAE